MIGEQLQMAGRKELFTKILYDIQSGGEVDKLRFLWSCQKMYLRQYQFYEYILPELKKMKFTDNITTQNKISEEIAYLLTGCFEY